MDNKPEDEPAPVPENPTHFGADKKQEQATPVAEPVAELQPYIILGFDENGQAIIDFGALDLDSIELLLAQAQVDFLHYRNDIVRQSLMTEPENADG